MPLAVSASAFAEMAESLAASAEACASCAVLMKLLMVSHTSFEDGTVSFVDAPDRPLVMTSLDSFTHAEPEW